MTYRDNVIHGTTSDIFNLHNLNKAEVKPPTRQKNHNNNSFDFISCQTLDSLPNNCITNPKPPIHTNNSFHSTVFSNQQETAKPGRKYLAKNTLVLGKEDNSSYIVKRSKNSSWDPNKYYKNPTAYERKIQQLYGNNSKYIEEGNPKLKSSLGKLESEIKLVDNETPSGNIKDKTYYMLYHTNGAPKKNWSSLAASYNKNGNDNKKALKNSVDGQFTEGKEAIYNHVESLKSNIFFNPDMEKRNKELFASKSKGFEPSEDIHIHCNDYLNKEHYQKKNRRLNQDELIYAKADWKDPKSYLHFRNRSETDETARNRKLNDLLGSKEFNTINRTSSVVKEREREKESDLHMREAFESKYHKQHPQELESKVKKQGERISTIPNENNQHLYKPIRVNINNNKAERISYNYEVKNFANVKDVNFEHIEKVFRDKGMHIYGTKADNSYYDGKTVGKLVFSIRDNPNGNEWQFRSKFNEAKEEIRKDTGLDIKTAEIGSNQKKAIASTVPTTLSWDYARVYNYVRGRDIEKTINEKTHLKGGYGAEKITNTVVNHDYKKK